MRSPAKTKRLGSVRRASLTTSGWNFCSWSVASNLGSRNHPLDGLRPNREYWYLRILVTVLEILILTSSGIVISLSCPRQSGVSPDPTVEFVLGQV